MPGVESYESAADTEDATNRVKNRPTAPILRRINGSHRTQTCELSPKQSETFRPTLRLGRHCTPYSIVNRPGISVAVL